MCFCAYVEVGEREGRGTGGGEGTISSILVSVGSQLSHLMELSTMLIHLCMHTPTLADKLITNHDPLYTSTMLC